MRRFLRRILRALLHGVQPTMHETIMSDISGHPDFAIIEGVWVREYPDGYVGIVVLADEQELLDRPYLLHMEHRLSVVLKCPVGVGLRSTQGRDPALEPFYSPHARLLYRRDV